MDVFTNGSFFQKDALIIKLNANKAGTVFLNYYGEINQKEFLQTFEKIPDSLKYAYLTIRDKGGNTLIHHFIKWAEIELLKETFRYLKEDEKYFCTTFRNDKGETPLHWVVINGNKETGLCMLNSIQDLDLRVRCSVVQDNEGITPLETQTRCINPETLKEALKASLGLS